jgi:hypothetical protein
MQVASHTGRVENENWGPGVHEWCKHKRNKQGAVASDVKSAEQEGRGATSVGCQGPERAARRATNSKSERPLGTDT